MRPTSVQSEELIREAAERLEWTIKPRGLGTHVDIYTKEGLEGKRVVHGVLGIDAQILVNDHNSSLRCLVSKVHGDSASPGTPSTQTE